MLRKLDHNNMGKSNLGWLRSVFHFSFAEYYNPKNINFGVLRVINDDLIAPHTGFPKHPHQNMEIVSYSVDGNLTHGDSMGNENTITRGIAELCFPHRRKICHAVCIGSITSWSRRSHPHGRAGASAH